MMLNDLAQLFESISNKDTKKEDYFNAIIDANCLKKKSASNRKYTAQYLSQLYLLDPGQLVFRALKYFWDRDVQSRALVAFLCAFKRDPILSAMTQYVLQLAPEARPDKSALEKLIEEKYPGRFSETMRSSLGRNLLSSWTQAGFLKGKVAKYRQAPKVTMGVVAYALLLGFLKGIRGMNLFTCEFVKLLGTSTDHLLELAENASAAGFLVLKRVGDVVEVSFPNFLTQTEIEALRVQNS